MSNDRLYPKNPNAKEFFKYFTYHWSFLVSPAGIKDWKTISGYKLQPRVLWHRFHDVNQILGVGFGQTTRYGMIDVDRPSLQHFANNLQAFQDLCAAFELIGLCRFVILVSSFSEGIHIYFPLPEEVNSFDLACALRMAVEGAGFKIKAGQLELFPNTKAYKQNKNGKDFSHFNGHRLPLQPKTGSILLDEDLTPYSQDLGTFFNQMDWAAEGQDIERLKEILSISRDWYYKRKYRFAQTSNSNKVRQWQEDTEVLIQEGFTDFGQTNELIREIGKYGRVFLALGGTELCQYMLETVTNLPGYQQYCRHKKEIEQRCQHWSKIIQPYWWPLGTTPTRHTSYPKIDEQQQRKPKNSLLNLERATDFKNRLKQTLDYLIKQAIALPKKVGERIELLCQISKQLFGKAFSQGSLKKPSYKTFWHPKYDQMSTGLVTESNICTKQNKLQNTSSQKDEKILHEPIQSKKPSEGQSNEKITPPDVACKSDLVKKCPKDISNGQPSKKDHTPPYMKGFVFLSPYLAYRTWVLISDLIPDLIKSRIREVLRSFLIPAEFKTSEQKLKEISQARKKKVFYYHGLVLVQYRLDVRRVFRKERLKPLPRLEPGTKVKITTDYNISTLNDDDHPIIVYVKPVDAKAGSKPFQVLLESLVEVDEASTEVYNSVFSSSLKFLLPQIKCLVISLNLTREDYLDYLKKHYRVDRTYQLYSIQLFEVIRHFQQLYLEVLATYQ